jgi:hypothetical protein
MCDVQGIADRFEDRGAAWRVHRCGDDARLGPFRVAVHRRRRVADLDVNAASSSAGRYPGRERASGCRVCGTTSCRPCTRARSSLRATPWVGRAHITEFGRLRDGSWHLNYPLYDDRHRRTPDGWKFTERVDERSDTSTPLRWQPQRPTQRPTRFPNPSGSELKD